MAASSRKLKLESLIWSPVSFVIQLSREMAYLERMSERPCGMWYDGIQYFLRNDSNVRYQLQ